MQTTSLASNHSAHFGIQKQIITKLQAANSIVNTDKGTQVSSCDQLCQPMNESCAKIKYVFEFSQLKIPSLALQHEKRTRSNWWSSAACFKCTVTDHRSVLVVNKFCACMNVVKFI